MCAEIDLESWRQYLAAFDRFLTARKHRDPVGAFFARAAMLHELHRERDIHPRQHKTRRPLKDRRDAA